MKQKSITFRCSEPQFRRLEQALTDSGFNRTDFISAALESFLSYAETKEAQQLDLFSLVEAINAQGDGTRFEEQL